MASTPRVRIQSLNVGLSQFTTFEKETFNKLCLNSPPGGWLPALRDLSWCIAGSNLPYADIFFSPNLRKILSPRHGYGTKPSLSPIFYQLFPRSSPPCRHRIFNSYRYASIAIGASGGNSSTCPPLSLCVVDHHSRSTTPLSRCRTQR